MDFFDRQYKLVLTTPKGKTLELTGTGVHGMDVRFNIESGIDGSPSRGTVTITGLSRDDISRYIGLSVLDEGTAASKMMRLDLSVGYRTTGMFNIVSAYVVSGRSTPPPDLSLTLNVDESYTIGRDFSKIIGGVDWRPLELYKVFDVILGTWGIFFSKKNSFCKDNQWLDVKVKVQSKVYDFNGARNYVKSLIGNRSMFISGNQLYIYDKYESGSRPHWGTISKENGLIGVSDIDLTSCTIRSFLQDFGGAMFPTIRLGSEYNRQANRKYMILGKTYKGDFRGNSWETSLKCTLEKN